MQISFVPGKGTIDAIFIMRQMMEKYEAAGRKLHMVFENRDNLVGIKKKRNNKMRNKDDCGNVYK